MRRKDLDKQKLHQTPQLFHPFEGLSQDDIVVHWVIDLQTIILVAFLFEQNRTNILLQTRLEVLISVKEESGEVEEEVGQGLSELSRRPIAEVFGELGEEGKLLLLELER